MCEVALGLCLGEREFVWYLVVLIACENILAVFGGGFLGGNKSFLLNLLYSFNCLFFKSKSECVDLSPNSLTGWTMQCMSNVISVWRCCIHNPKLFHLTEANKKWVLCSDWILFVRLTWMYNMYELCSHFTSVLMFVCVCGYVWVRVCVCGKKTAILNSQQR